jgi:hypothetical protein
MKTEQQYADELIEKHVKNLIVNSSDHFNYGSVSVKCAIIDVTNTIEAIEDILIREYGHCLIDMGQVYYKTVLTILKDKI